jgi:hypothetical protein
MEFLDLEARRYLKHIGWDANEIWGPPINYSADSNLAMWPSAVTRKRVTSQHMSLDNDSSEQTKDTTVTTENIHSAPAKLTHSKVPHTEGACRRPAKREGAVSLNSTEEEEEAKQWERQGSPRWLIRVLEGESSDTWVDASGKKRRREWADPLERVEDMGFAEMQGLVAGAKTGKGVGVGLRPIVKDEEDLWGRGWGINEYKLNDINAMVNVPSIKDCMDETKERAAAARQEQLSPYGTYVPYVPANIAADAPFDGTNATSRPETGYFGLLSDVNWSPRERVLYNIPPDPQVLPEGLSSVHVRRHVTAEEFLGVTAEQISSSAPPVFLPREPDSRGF